MMVRGAENSLDPEREQFDLNTLLLATKRSLKKLTPTLAQDTFIDDAKLITKVLELNRRGEKKMIQKIVCPFCCSLITPERRLGFGGITRWNVTNFNRHLNRAHARK